MKKSLNGILYCSENVEKYCMRNIQFFNIKGNININGGLEFVDREGGSLSNQNQNTY